MHADNPRFARTRHRCVGKRLYPVGEILFKEGIRRPVQTFKRLLFAVSSLALFACAAHAQSGHGVTVPDDASNRQERQREMGSPEEEIIRRAEIKHEEESHKEMVDRADETALIGEQILNSFQKNKSLSKDDLKKLDRMEKLARKIRGSAGGSDDDEQLEDPPGRIEPAVARLAKLSEDLRDCVAKTSRFVTSAKVIERSNELIELIRHIRTIRMP